MPGTTFSLWGSSSCPAGALNSTQGRVCWDQRPDVRMGKTELSSEELGARVSNNGTVLSPPCVHVRWNRRLLQARRRHKSSEVCGQDAPPRMRIGQPPTQAHNSAALGCTRKDRARGLAGARSRSAARVMEQRLAEFREARKRAGLAAQPSTSSQEAQTSGEKEEVAATPKAVPSWLRQFLVLVWKPRPASARAPPIHAQVS